MSAIVLLRHCCLRSVGVITIAAILCFVRRTLLQISEKNGDMLLRVSVKDGVVALQSGNMTYTNPTWKVPDEEWHHLTVQVGGNKCCNIKYHGVFIKKHGIGDIYILFVY